MHRHYAHRGAGGRRAAIGLADQSLYTFTNFALTVLVARSVSRADFGGFAIVIASYLIGASTLRGLTSEAFIVRYSALDKSTQREGAVSALSAALGASVGIATIGLIIGTQTYGSIRSPLIVFCIFFPAVIVQDSLRFIALAVKRPTVALANDALMAIVQFGLVAFAIVLHRTSVAAFVGAWGLGACAGAALAMTVLRMVPGPRPMMAWYQRNMYLSIRYAADDLVAQSSQQGATFAVAGIAGLEGAGAIRGAQTVFGPSAIIALGVQTAVIPELVRVLQRSSTRLRHYVYAISVALAVAGIAWGLAAWSSPDWIGTALFGPTWFSARPLIPYFMLAQAGAGLSIGPIVGLRALGAANRTLTSRVLVISAGLAVSIVGGILGGALGVAISRAVVNPLQFGVWQLQFDRALKEHRQRVAISRISSAWNELDGPAASDGGIGII